MSQSSLQTLSIVVLVLLLGFTTYSVYRNHRSLDVCHEQLARVDALDAQINNLKR